MNKLFCLLLTFLWIYGAQAQVKQCKQNGEYCLTHSECCSRSCLSFSYKCVPVSPSASTSNIYVPPPPTTTVDPSIIDNRFGEGDNQTTTAVTEKQCALAGEYCTSGYDCCSGSCLSFSYKCIDVHGGNTRPRPSRPQGQVTVPQQPSTITQQRPITAPAQTTTDTIIDNRFDTGDTTTNNGNTSPANTQNTPKTCAKDGEYCLLASDCCSKSCLSFSYKCVKSHQPPANFASFVPPTQPSTVIDNRFGEDQNPSTATCAKDGEYCLTHSECCSRSCLSFSYKCVKTNQPQYQQVFPIPSPQPATIIDNRFGSAEPANGNCFTNGQMCSYNEQCCTRACYKGKCATQIQIGISETQLLQPSVVNGPVIYVTSLDDLLDRFTVGNKNAIQNRNYFDSGSGQCKNAGEMCTKHQECCAKNCHSYLHKCVT